MDRLKVYPDQAPDNVMANVLTTWRDHLDPGPTVGEENGNDVMQVLEEVSLATEEANVISSGEHGGGQINTV